MAIARVLMAVLFAMVLTAPSTAATTSTRKYRPSVMKMEYAAGGLTATVHAPRSLVGELPLVLAGSELLGPGLARQGFVVVVVRDGAPGRHLELWRALVAGEGPLVERFSGFARHLDLTATVAEP
jgi:hypothetical protein